VETTRTLPVKQVRGVRLPSSRSHEELFSVQNRWEAKQKANRGIPPGNKLTPFFGHLYKKWPQRFHIKGSAIIGSPLFLN
jgi:hypothetical protein